MVWLGKNRLQIRARRRIINEAFSLIAVHDPHQPGNGQRSCRSPNVVARKHFLLFLAAARFLDRTRADLCAAAVTGRAPLQPKGGNVRAERVRRLALYFPAVLAGLAGCGPQDPHVVPLTAAENRLKFVAMAYTDAHSSLGHPPENPDELRPFLKAFGDPDELLTSPNDGKPFVVIWGKNPTGGPTDYKGLFPILAYEQQGSAGQRAVTDIRGRPMTVPEVDLPKLKYIGGHKPSSP
jgi:hypothetical protein